MKIDDPAVLAELRQCHDVYEKALMENDADILDSLFWDSPHAIRFGVAENLHGADEIRAFRKGRPKVDLARDILRLDIMALGTTAGIVNLEFVRAVDGVERHGRQTQFWFRFDEGWRIASAHVSLLPLPKAPAGGMDVYMNAASSRIGLGIDKANYSAVEADLKNIAAIAGFLLQFPLDPNVEAAPVFQP